MQSEPHRCDSTNTGSEATWNASPGWTVLSMGLALLGLPVTATELKQGSHVALTWLWQFDLDLLRRTSVGTTGSA